MTPPARYTATKVRPAGLDEYGDPTTATTSTIRYYATAPRTQGAGASSKSLDGDVGRQGVIEGLTMYAPPGQDIRHTDQIILNGVTYDVDGEVGDWLNPYSQRHPGVEINLRRAEG